MVAVQVATVAVAVAAHWTHGLLPAFIEYAPDLYNDIYQ